MRLLLSKRPSPGSFSLSALLLVSCLLILVTGPFYAALAFLRADSNLAQSLPYRNYQAIGTHALRLQNQPGSGEFYFEEELLGFIWQKTQLGEAEMHHIHLTAPESLGWPAAISLWFETDTARFEVRGMQTQD